MSFYKIQMYVKCTEEKAESLHKELAHCASQKILDRLYAESAGGNGNE